MTTGSDDEGSDGHSERVPDPQGTVRGIPYDFRRPTIARNRARYWNGDDRRLFTPKVVGAGWDINVFWLIHPLRYLRSRRPSG